MPPGPAPASDPLAPLRSPSFLSELRRKAIHLSLLVLPLDVLLEVLPWPRGRGQWTLLLLVLAFGALALDVLRLHEERVKRLFRDFLGGMLRDHEELGLLGSTYLLLAALLAVDLFPRPVAAAALGFTVLGDGFAAIVGKAWGRTRIFRKTAEGAGGGLVACLAWAACLAAMRAPALGRGAGRGAGRKSGRAPADTSGRQPRHDPHGGLRHAPPLEPPVTRSRPLPEPEFSDAVAHRARGSPRPGDRADRRRWRARARCRRRARPRPPRPWRTWPVWPRPRATPGRPPRRSSWRCASGRSTRTSTTGGRACCCDCSAGPRPAGPSSGR